MRLRVQLPITSVPRSGQILHGKKIIYEHIVRNDKGLERIRKYIFDNPAQWESDRFYT